MLTTEQHMEAACAPLPSPKTTINRHSNLMQTEHYTCMSKLRLGILLQKTQRLQLPMHLNEGVEINI